MDMEGWLNAFDEACSGTGSYRTIENDGRNYIYILGGNNTFQLLDQGIQTDVNNTEMLKASMEGRLFVSNSTHTGVHQIVTYPDPDASEGYSLYTGESVAHLKGAQLPDGLEKPSIWKRIFFFFFLDEIRAYNEQQERFERAVEAMGNPTEKTPLADSIGRALQESNRQVERKREELKQRMGREQEKTVTEVRQELPNTDLYRQTIATAKAYAEGSRQLDADADLGENEDAMDGLEMIREEHRAGMQEKAALIQELMDGTLVEDPAQLRSRLGRILLAEQLQETVEKHNLLNREQDMQEVNPLYVTVGIAGADFEKMAQNISLSTAADKLTRIARDKLLDVLSNPRELSEINRRIRVESGLEVEEKNGAVKGADVPESSISQSGKGKGIVVGNGN